MFDILLCRLVLSINKVNKTEIDENNFNIVLYSIDNIVAVQKEKKLSEKLKPAKRRGLVSKWC